MTLSAFIRALGLPRNHHVKMHRAGRDTIAEISAYGWEVIVTRERGRWRVAWADARRSDAHIIASIPAGMWHRGARKHAFFWGAE